MSYCTGCGVRGCTGACGRAGEARFCRQCGRRLVSFASPGWISWRCPAHPDEPVARRTTDV